MKLILASASKGRQHLLSLLKVPFDIIASSVEEDKIVGKTPLETIRLRAKRKGEKVYRRIRNQESRIKKLSILSANWRTQLSTHLILSADSGAILDNRLFGKPKDETEGRQMLKALSDKTHQFVTAIEAFKIGTPKKDSPLRTVLKRWSDDEMTLVTFRNLTLEDITLYLKLTNYKQFAAGYTLFGSPQNFIVKIDGSISNVIGLPLEKIIPILRENCLL